jgi:hypothetical protein
MGMGMGNQKSKIKNQKAKMGTARLLVVFLIFDFCLLIFDLPLRGQSFTQRGFFDTSVTLFPESAPGDSGQAVATWPLRARLESLSVAEAVGIV